MNERLTDRNGGVWTKVVPIVYCEIGLVAVCFIFFDDRGIEGTVVDARRCSSFWGE